MAWKLRKDKLREDAPLEEPSLADTAAPPETAPETSAFAPEPPPFQFDSLEAEAHPLVFAAPESHAPAGIEVEEPSFSPAYLDEVSFITQGLGAAPGSIEEPRPETPAPVFLDEPLSAGPFAPFQPEEAAPPEAPDPEYVTPEYSAPESHATEYPFLLLDREEVAPSLVHTDPDSDVPRVAPFIVDLPPAAEQTPLTGAITVRIGNFSAHFVLTKDVTVIGRPDSLLQSYPDVEIELDDAVSRRHAEIRRQEAGYVLVDLLSTNGTLLNGERLVPHREYLLHSGDRVNLGDRTEIVFE